MARKGKSPEELAAANAFFSPGAIPHVQRLLQRAAEQAIRAARAGPRSSGQGGIAVTSMARSLATAMQRHGATRWQKPSAKQRAPDTGGRSFHFRHSQVVKGGAKRRESTGTAQGGRTSRKSQAGVAAAHEAYIERGSAVERAVIADEPAAAVHADPHGSDGPSHDDLPTLAVAAQAYVENPAKVADDAQLLFSFGNIGESLSERMAFWQALEAAERKGGRVQSRIVWELPHEASARARHDMVRRFCGRLEAMGLPYWAVVHAPTEANDSRNYHCHVVYNEAPAKRMIDPADGEQRWDFEIVGTYTTSSRHKRKNRPHRQNTHDSFRSKTAIRTMREWAASDANAVLERHKVKDKDGEPVRYDARSYADMGLDVVPMPTISRVAVEAVRKGRRGAHEGDLTRTMAQAELQVAAASRDPALLEVAHLEKTLTALTRAPEPTPELRQALPQEMQGSWRRQPSVADLGQSGDAVLAARSAAVADDILERSARMALDTIAAATASDQEASSRPYTGDAAPGNDHAADLAALNALHAAAQEELAQLEETVTTRKRRAKERIAAALQVWRDITGADQPDLIRPAHAAGEAAPVPAVTSPVMPDEAQRERSPTTARDIAPEMTPPAEPPTPAGATPPGEATRPAKARKPVSEKDRAKRRAVLSRRQGGGGR